VAVLGLVLFAAAFSLFSCTIALHARAQETLATFVHLVNMPLLFTSTALVPRAHMPDWLAGMAGLNPLSLAVELWRGALLSIPVPDLAGKLIYLTVMTVFFFLAALEGMKLAARRY
jgi:ABC-2 type transport system permease protein